MTEETKAQPLRFATTSTILLDAIDAFGRLGAKGSQLKNKRLGPYMLIASMPNDTNEGRGVYAYAQNKAGIFMRIAISDNKLKGEGCYLIKPSRLKQWLVTLPRKTLLSFDNGDLYAPDIGRVDGKQLAIRGYAAEQQFGDFLLQYILQPAPLPQLDPVFAITRPSLAHLVNAITPFASADDARPTLAQVELKYWPNQNGGDGSKFTAVAADGFSLAFSRKTGIFTDGREYVEFMRTAETSKDELRSVLLPADLLQTTEKLMRSNLLRPPNAKSGMLFEPLVYYRPEHDKPANFVQWPAEMICVGLGPVTLFCKALDDARPSFPQWLDLLPKPTELAYAFIFDRADLVKALRRLLVFSDDYNQGLRLLAADTNYATLTVGVEPGKHNWFTAEILGGIFKNYYAEKPLPTSKGGLPYRGPKNEHDAERHAFTVGVNCRFLLRAAKSLEAENVALCFYGHGGAPLVLAPAFTGTNATAGERYVIQMPMHLDYNTWGEAQIMQAWQEYHQLKNPGLVSKVTEQHEGAA